VTDSVGTLGWRINDEVTQLREWASERVHPLPLRRGDTWTIGSANGCWLRLEDPELRVSRKHAQLTYEPPEGWTLADLQSKNGLLLDGTPRVSFPLKPGAEVAIGGITLIAESPLLCVLRDVLARLIGWSAERRADVDVALRAVRRAATLHEPLLLSAAAGHRSIATLLHRHVIGTDRPFIVCERRKPVPKRTGQKAAPVRAATTYERGLVALAAATGGTLVVWKNRLPEDFNKVLLALRAPNPRVLLVLCSQTPPQGPETATQLVVPSLAGRSRELRRIIDECAAEAVAELGGALTPDDRRWIEQQAKTFAAIQTATRRLIALRAAGCSVKRAAKQLGIAHGTLSVWVARRDLPELRGARDDDDEEDDDDEDCEDDDEGLDDNDGE
jgi:hypothetical protein